MSTFAAVTDPAQRRFYRIAAFGFLILWIGYMLRARLVTSQPAVVLLLGVLPNLVGSFATPFALAALLDQRLPRLQALSRPAVFLAVNLFTFAICLLIEWGHVFFLLGFWDPNDIIASALGGLAAVGVFAGVRGQGSGVTPEDDRRQVEQGDVDQEQRWLSALADRQKKKSNRRSPRSGSADQHR